MADEPLDKGEPQGRWVERRSGASGPVPLGGDRRRRLSELSPEEFARLARWRSGLDPQVPDPGEPDGAGWVTGVSGPTVSSIDDRAAGCVGPEPGDGDSVEADPDIGPAGGGPDGDPDGGGPDPGPGPGGDTDGRPDGGGSDPDPDPGSGNAQGADRGRWHWPEGEARTGGFEPGVGAVVAALESLETPGDLDDDALSTRVTDLVRLHSLVAAALSTNVAVWDKNSLWTSDRSKSPGARLSRDANCAKSSAAGWVMMARDIARMPGTAAAWAEGRLSTDHVRRLTRACSDDRLARFRAAEAELIATAVELAGDFAGFARAVQVWEQYVDDDLHDPTDPNDVPKNEKRQRSGRHCSDRPNDIDGYDLTASLTKVGGEIVRTQLQRCYDDLWRQDWLDARSRLGPTAVISDADLGRTVRQRRADALVEMARRAGACRPGDVMPKPLITIHVTAAEMTGPIRETFNGLVMTRRDVADLIADQADWERIIYGPGGQPVNLTSTQRNFTGALRRAVQLRDRVCSHPTCDIDAERCQVDHIVEHTDGGPTNIDNARLLCPKHNLQRPGRGKKPPPRGARGDDADHGDGEDDGG